MLKEDELDPELVGAFPDVPDDIFLPDHDAEFDPAKPEAKMLEADDYTPEAYNEYLMAEVLLPNMGTVTKAKAIGWKQDANGNPVGWRNSNLILDTWGYEVEFADDAMDVFTVNMIAENLYLQVDSEGNSYSIMSEITDCKSDGSAIKKDDGMETTSDGREEHPKWTTKGWKLIVNWKDGPASWVSLKDLKEAYPVQVAEYALTNKILEEPAFAWWARHVLKKHDQIIHKIKSPWYWARMHKYGIILPKSIKEALWINRETVTYLWLEAIEKEMQTIDCAFEFPKDNQALVGYQKIDCHMVFNVKMILERKACYVAGGHQTEPTKDIMFASVVLKGQHLNRFSHCSIE
jgi:hypothetical protein